MRRSLRRFVSDEAGTESLEWGLICGLLVVGAIAAIVALKPKLAKVWTDTQAQVAKP